MHVDKDFKGISKQTLHWKLYNTQSIELDENHSIMLYVLKTQPKSSN